MSGGVDTIIGQVNTLENLLNVNIMNHHVAMMCSLPGYQALPKGLYYVMRSACAGFECQIWMLPKEMTCCECDVIELLMGICWERIVCQATTGLQSSATQPMTHCFILSGHKPTRM